ncbi:MAG: flagellar hook-basal body complex protein [Pseudomonadota bacterium]
MTVSSSLNAGISGLTANATRLATIADNISNAGTIGFKRSQVDFSNQVLQQTSSAFSAGGVRVEAFRDVAATGPLITTNGETDLAVAGRGLLPVTDFQGVDLNAGQRELSLLPTGSFEEDENGYLRTRSGHFLLGWPADELGNIGNINRSSGTDLQPVNVSTSQFVAAPTTQINLGSVNLPAELTESDSSGTPVDLPIEYFDNLGRSQTLTLRYTPVVPATGSSNQWQVEIFDNAGDPTVSIGSLDVTFSDAAATGGRIDTATAAGGATYDAATGNLSINVANGPIDIFIGTPGGTSGLSQLAAPFSPAGITRNGTPIGDLQSINVDERGFVQAVFNTGFRRTLFQVPVADVPNLNGLEAQNGQAFSLTGSSGDLFLWDSGAGPVGTIESFTLQESNTDIATELTDLIETQRSYSSNAQLIRTVDEILQETTNL